MKKLLILGALALVGSVAAQTFGIKAGLNVASIGNAEKLAENEGASSVSAKSKLGFNAGVYMNAPLSSTVSIQPELLYSSKGAKFEADGEEVGLHLDYLTVPVMFQYHLVPEFYLEAGPEFGFALSSKMKIENESDDIKDDINSFDFGVGIGAGYRISNTNLGVTARYVVGFTDVMKDNPTDTSYTNRVFQVGLQYGF